MNKKCEISLPISAYGQPIIFSIHLVIQLSFFIRFDNISFTSNLLNWVIIVLSLSVIIIQLISNAGFTKEIEITENGLKTKKLELPINKIEKLIIQGYFIQSIGIKQIGKRFVSTKLHFRFKHNSELQIREWEQWAEENGIKVVKGTIYTWI
ncbi:MAG: hypothetical protein NAG76_20795 [Candidatus Pristimantibacillus lignocellulolyticus]|uniref:Uncharacterized protein n=1 Tax=Candidatus Pristimantibacillus lignocellulolyticus TaxID=2994561 RepID=A0A9J6ZEA3_9BACL|nr:MAG: hypothetical protein NAG76_20795 [Candidatus Pristimantibacillus lignocellulolyticus]